MTDLRTGAMGSGLLWLALALLCATAAHAGCGARPQRASAPPAKQPLAATPADAGTVAPPGAAYALQLLEVPKHSPAAVSVPTATAGGKPLLVAAHGAGGRPEWQCEYWSEIVRGRGFVLCPRGRRFHLATPHGHSLYYYPNHYWLRKAVHAALEALAERFPDQVDIERAVYAGYSQGAIMGALFVSKDPTRFPRAVFIEGGGNEWNVPVSLAYRQGGGRRVAFACGLRTCEQSAQQAARYLRKAGMQARAAYVAAAGHSYIGPLQLEIVSAFEWVVQDDPRWR